jgi:predicted PurR-regulated permease PerM
VDCGISVAEILGDFLPALIEHTMKSPGGDSNPQRTVDSALPTGRPKASWPLIVLASIVTVAALYYSRDLAIPLVFALLLTLLLRPLFRRLQRLRVPDVVASLLVVLAVAALYVAGTLTVAQQGQQWLAKAPEMIKSVQAMLPKEQGPLSHFTQTTEAVRELATTDSTQEEAPVPVVMRSSDATITVLGTSGHYLAASLIVLVLTFFMLAYSDTLLKQAVESRANFADKKAVVSSLHNVETGISTYLATVTVINIGLGIVTALVVWMLGIPNPLLWGLVAMVLNYVPHVGALVCEVILFFVGAVAHESLWHGAGAAGAFFVLTTVESYFITPIALSKSLQLSPLAVILSVLFWGWLWGIAGGLLAAPLLTVVKVVCDQFEFLKPVSMLLAGAVNEASTAPQEHAADKSLLLGRSPRSGAA